MIYERIIRPVLFALSRKDAEQAHIAAMRLLKVLDRNPSLCRLLERCLGPKDPSLCTTLFQGVENMGVEPVVVKSPIMLAGGFDKNLAALRALGSLGFGAIEGGTITPKAQFGKPRPRIFRLPDTQALINRMGFPNVGGVRAHINLATSQDYGFLPTPIGISIGSGLETPPERAIEDYVAVLRQVMHPTVSWISVNVSSPNTPAARIMASRQFIGELLCALDEVLDVWQQRFGSRPAKLVKLSPDMSWSDVGVVLAAPGHVDGYIAVNTTMLHAGFHGLEHEAGGRSGPPLLARATEFMRCLRGLLGRTKTVIGVGGVSNARDVLQLKEAGADAVQVYTSFIYQGPLAPSRWNRDLATVLRNANCPSFSAWGR